MRPRPFSPRSTVQGCVISWPRISVKQNNLPHLAQNALAAVLGACAIDVVVATQAEGFDWLTL
ncbi:MAG: hypothetical protein CBHOC_2568 [uncultured Caballeronia sp.]|nr:MAG: hypothetical protein CBHOC_2568 [uncultured Caballeronia sp.]